MPISLCLGMFQNGGTRQNSPIHRTTCNGYQVQLYVFRRMNPYVTKLWVTRSTSIFNSIHLPFFLLPLTCFSCSWCFSNLTVPSHSFALLPVLLSFSHKPTQLASLTLLLPPSVRIVACQALMFLSLSFCCFHSCILKRSV